MKVKIDCMFNDGQQDLFMEPATESDIQFLTEASQGDPDEILSVPCRPENGTTRPYLIRAGCIRSVSRV